MLPILYKSSDLIIYAYPLFMGLGWGVAYQIFFSLIDASVSRISAQVLYWGLFVSAWFGSKFLFYLTAPGGGEDLLANSSFWLGGGFVFYGGLLAGIAFLLIYKGFGFPLTEKNFWPVLPALTIGHAIGRIGCFLAGCCFGKETNFFWGVFLHGHFRHPTQLIEAFGLLALGLHILKSKKSKSVLLSEYFIVYGVLRFSVELLRGDGVRGQWLIFTPSQWISIVLFVAGILIYLSTRKHESTKSALIK